MVYPRPRPREPPTWTGCHQPLTGTGMVAGAALILKERQAQRGNEAWPLTSGGAAWEGPTTGGHRELAAHQVHTRGARGRRHPHTGPRGRHTQGGSGAPLSRGTLAGLRVSKSSLGDGGHGEDRTMDTQVGRGRREGRWHSLSGSTVITRPELKHHPRSRGH